MKDNFTPVIHSGTIRQAARLTVINKEISSKKTDDKDIDIKNQEIKENKKEEDTNKCIYPGDTAIIEVKFMYRPEIIEPGQVFFMREGLTLGIGSFI